MKMEDVLEQAAVMQNEYLKKYKSDGGRVIGYACIATPVEIVEAAGMLPYRLRALGNNRTEIADAHLSRFNCSFCRSVLQLGLDGTYDFLDGLIETNGCDHIRGMFENWQYVNPSEFFHYVRVPHVMTEDSLEYFTNDLRLWSEALQKHFDVAISEDDLWSAIRQQDRIRAKLKKVTEMRERDEPAFTGTEVMAAFLLGTAMMSTDFEKVLDRLIEQRENHKITDIKARLLLGGSATDEVEFLEMIESQGGHISADNLCYGSRAFWGREAGESGDPYAVLAGMYLENLPCPRMFVEFPYRRDLMISSVERAKTDGVILVHNKFCDVHGVDNVQLRLALEKRGIPVLSLEKEYGATADLGRMKTRVQAFLERIAG